MAPFFWTVTPLIKKTYALPVQIVLLSFSIQTAFGIVFFTKQIVCLSLEKKRNQYEQVFVPFFWIVGYIIKKTPASPVPIVILSFSIQTPSVISFLTKLLMGVSLKRKKINMNRFWLPFSELLEIFSRKPLKSFDLTWKSNSTYLCVFDTRINHVVHDMGGGKKSVSL